MTHQRSRDAKRRVNRRGATTVEMAFAAPVFFTIVFGLMELGHAFMVQHLIQDAARQGCRAAILPRSTNTAVTNTVNGLLQGEGITKATTTILVNNVSGNVATAQTTDDICVQVTIATSDVSLVPGCSFFNYLKGQLLGSFSLRHQ